MLSRVIRLVVGIAAGAAMATVSSIATADDSDHGSLSLLVENDVFYNTDRDYTAGQQIDYTTAPSETPEALVNLAHDMPWLLTDQGKVRASYALGQDIFTPANTLASDPPLNQRPYAGYLFLGLGLLANDNEEFDEMQLQLGVIGPASLARDAQAFVHSILGQRTPSGWHFQLRDEPALLLTFDRSLRILPRQSFLGLQFDVEPRFGAAVGNVYDYVSAGGMARLGFNLQDDYGPPRMEPTLSGSSFLESDDEFGAYVFAGVDGRAVARNIFLDGNSFEDSRSVSKRPFIGDLELGAAVTVDRFRLSFTHVFRTKEYYGQPTSDQFGSVNLTAAL
jgi:lipid A 3-O-deacylase